MSSSAQRTARYVPSLRNLSAFYRYLWLWVLYPAFRTQLVFVDSGANIRIERGTVTQFGRDVRIMRDFSAHVAGRLVVGDRVFFNRGCHLVALDRVDIGDDCLFGEGVSIHDEQHVLGSDARPIAQRGFCTAPIVIGRSVWVGAKATITAGVTIGDNAVIGANAVVTHDIPAHCIAVGVPARVIRTLRSEDCEE